MTRREVQGATLRPMLMRTLYLKKNTFRQFFYESSLRFGAQIGRDIAALKDETASIVNKKYMFSFGTDRSGAQSFLKWIADEFNAEDVSHEQEERLRRLVAEYPKIRAYIRVDADQLVFDHERFAEDVVAGRFKETIFGLTFDIQSIIETAINTGSVALDFSIEPFKKELLLCDHVRANIQPYPERLLTDMSLGHWELYEELTDDGREDSVCLRLPPTDFLVARPPQLDVIMNGTCAIDFGTRSTVVVCRDRDARLLRIGKGDYSHEPTIQDYENPTAIELIDIEKFKMLYRAREGRPYTEWAQVTASHQAADAIFERQSTEGISVYYSVFSELKRWTRDTANSPILKDRHGYIQEVKPYAETLPLDAGGFDPIEIYAYYLGLYINNMHRSIYLDYILSFPVGYEKDVREHIRMSFERGLKKTLPKALLDDTEMMRRFRVYDGASEPAAYAVSALEAYGLEPKNPGEEVAYGVFDFGGGTTDFDFGVEYVPENRRRKFIIEQFGFGSDMYLGGENILELLAYEVFKDNLAEMRKHKITFALPPECETFAGAEALVRETRDAASHLNNKILAERLRPFWERGAGYDEFATGDGFKTTLTLFSSEKTGNAGNRAQVHIDIDVRKLERTLEDRIRRGVENFFQAMATAFKGRTVRQVHIFLAGNSCKAPMVRKLFEEYITSRMESTMRVPQTGKSDAKGKQSADAGKSAVPRKDDPFLLYLPLGMEDEEAGKGKKLNGDFDRMRTGKTGVAFGLLRCRKGGKDIKIINKNVDAHDELLFPYFLGSLSERGCFRVDIDARVDYGTWSYFTYADEDEFELYYTQEPRALQGHMKASEVRMVRCIIDDDDVSDDDEVGVYIRKKSPNTIEYTVASEKALGGKNYKGKIYTVRL